MKKVTMKVIAEEAGVSVATVSYILNNVNNQSISAETRERVMKAAQRLNYKRNLTALALKSGKSELIGVLLPDQTGEPYWARYRYSQALYHLGKHLNDAGYQLVVSYIDPQFSKLPILLERELDGVFILNASSSIFHRISKHYGVGIPIIGIDTSLDDPLFHTVVPDFEAGIEEAARRLGAEPQFLLIDHYVDHGMTEQIREMAGMDEKRMHVYSSASELEKFLAQYSGLPGVVINEFLCEQALRFDTAGRLAALCTSGCPELISGRAETVVFDADAYREAAEVMIQYIARPQDHYPNNHILQKIVHGETLA
ncbi:LacI family DNA-binding transcriptional regulator [Paenibacillus sp. Cedars]|uniref:LacI family DNA-binding transcriptional regulator n=1 Tax=Paenibacillus sp. Cedars TaxID=1980674 RepID=UPI0015622440|nr:LacI family DNA-binding transcriptional regulator [Paenibacillus sp. Cedars]